MRIRNSNRAYATDKVWLVASVVTEIEGQAQVVVVIGTPPRETLMPSKDVSCKARTAEGKTISLKYSSGDVLPFISNGHRGSSQTNAVYFVKPDMAPQIVQVEVKYGGATFDLQFEKR